MRITELLKKESIELGVKVADKNAAIDKLISLMDAGGRLNSTQGYKEGILAREALGSTAIGEGIATRKGRGSKRTGTCSNGSSGRRGL